MKSSTKGIIAVVAFLVVFAVVALIITSTLNNAKEVSYSKIESEIMAGHVAKVNIDNDKVSVKYVDGQTDKNKKYDAYAYARDAFMQDLLARYNEARVADEKLPVIEVRFNDRNSGNIWNILYPIIGIILIGVMAFFLFRSMGSQNKQAMNFGKSKANAQSNLKVRFTDVAGADEEKQELQEIVEFLKSPQKFKEVGARIHKGVLL
nr:ATP-dependent metallopeptidase FtsH/Yme1/Tma family protein [Clostridiales bacterium]